MMRPFLTDRVIPVGLIFAIILVCLFGFWGWKKNHTPQPTPVVVESVNLEPKKSTLGTSVEGRPLEAYTYGMGKIQLAFVGGIHGGYEWNSVLLAYQFMDYLKANPNVLPENLTVTVIPNINPDGVFKIIGKEGRFTVEDLPKDIETAPGRFNANNVDLNRNFDCNWKSESTWQTKTVSAGTEVFSEPEARAIRDFATKSDLSAMIFWHSKSGTVYASQCKTGILPETLDIMNAYAKASGYKTDTSFDSYAITGAVEDWLASVDIPAITVELETHDDIELEKNLAGVRALFDYWNEKAVTTKALSS